MAPLCDIRPYAALIRRFCAASARPGSTQPSKNPPTSDMSFEEIFAKAKPTQQHKISEEGSYDALYQECMSDIYRRRAEADGYTDETRDSPEVLEFTRKEREITRAIFKRANPCQHVMMQQLMPKLDQRNEYIDPYWDPFKRLDGLKLQVAAEFNDLARLISAAEVRKQRKMIRDAAESFDKFGDPYANESEPKEASEPLASNLNDRFWDPDVDRRLVLQNNRRPFSFRGRAATKCINALTDLHVLHNFVAENGQILPRRLTFATRQQQRQIFKAIRVARQMALFPYEWKPRYRDRIPLMDPQQYLADELFHRYAYLGDLRAKAMLHVVMRKYPHVNCFRFLKHEAQRFTNGANFKETLDEHRNN
ncbi:ribosomal protein S18, putative [Babesia bigemina]|uniref:Ribosomal protein S18, putative n=1 Tax=Babesia bigemina TaxID=5866 RepID=A0A061D9R2_BABBI|nr:ribosomal protein S18, putative [Babesia bigemina]CDR94470.1 ribosomal protein S18, putative [Babesia bigemina]|eukprot:XP_012766656.1 ribosomal protein S18, putative [Babesia bigemina]